MPSGRLEAIGGLMAVKEERWATGARRRERRVKRLMRSGTVASCGSVGQMIYSSTYTGQTRRRESKLGDRRCRS